MNDWQARVVFERDDLKGKLDKLRLFIASEAFDKLPKVDRDLLLEQARHMTGYAGVLESRIVRF